MDPLKAQRDSYLAYSLAAADLLIEIDLDYNILSGLGAAKALLGNDAKAMAGTSLLEAFVVSDRSVLRRKLEKAKAQGRIDPVMLNLKQAGKPLLVNLGACRIGSRDDVLHVTLTVLPPVSQSSNAEKNAETGLLTQDSFLDMASDYVRTAGTDKSEMQLVRLSGLSQAVRQLPEDQHDMLFSEIGAALRGQSVGGQSAGRIDEDGFGLIPATPGQSEAALVEDMQAVARNMGLAPHILAPKVTSINLSIGELDEASVAKALSYIANGFTQGTRSLPQSLESGLNAAMEATMSQYGVMQAMIRDGDFQLHYQPIVNLHDGEIHHYEALLRANDGRNPYEIVTFSENMGLIMDLDLAVARKALDAVVAHPNAEVAINVSGYSAQNEQFCTTFQKIVSDYRAHSHRILFELTETGLVDHVETAVGFFKRLRQMGFAICLDDFGAGSASYHYLRHFEVDHVKIDGAFFNAAINDRRQQALIKSISALCRDLGSEVIAEMIEDEASADLARKLDITYGQGYHYGRPTPHLTPAPVATPSTSFAARRKGVTESWG